MGSFQKVFKRLIFLACLFFVLWQCYFSLKKFLQKPRSTSVQVDYSKKWPMPNFILCPVLKEDVLEDCNIKLEDYIYHGKWVGTGPSKNCTDPKILFENAIQQPSECINDVAITTFQGDNIFLSWMNDSFDSFWKPVDFVYDLVTFENGDPMVSFCYELIVPKRLQIQGVKSIYVKTQDVSVIKISPPGYLHQNSDVQGTLLRGIAQFSVDFLNLIPPAYLHQNNTDRIQLDQYVSVDLEYQIDNFLLIGEEYCNPDPLYSRDECAIKQLLNYSMELFGCIPPSLTTEGLEICANATSFSMREVDKRIQCPKPCTVFKMRSRTDDVFKIRFDPKDGVLETEVRFHELITISNDQHSYTWLNLVAEVGGYVGLFLGYSVLQVTDLMDILIQKKFLDEKIWTIFDK